MSSRIIQLTDCHVFADPNEELRGIATWPRLVATLHDIRRRVPDFDLLILTGDTAHDEDLATYQAVWDQLAWCSDRVRIIPGNHDDRAAMSRAFSQRVSDLPGRVTFTEDLEDWRLVGLDTQLPGQVAGSVADDQLLWLHQQMAESQLNNTLLLMHHPPIGVQCTWLDRIGLQDLPEFERFVGKHPQIRLIVCGHVHQTVAGSLLGAAVVTSAAVGPQFRARAEEVEIAPGPPAYRVIELHDRSKWTSTVLWA